MHINALRQNEIFKQTPCCLYTALRKAVRSIQQRYDHLMLANGIRGTQFSVLVHIAHCEPITLVKLSEALVMDRTSLTRSLNPLIKEGLIEIAVGEDKREKVIQLSEAGKALIERTLPVWLEIQDQLQAKLGSQGGDDLRGLLQKLTY